MSVIDQRRQQIQTVMQPHSDPMSRARRVYFDASSFALSGKHEVEFEIKKAVSNRYEVPFRSVVFSGSAQLGFSPHKDTEFVPGSSDLDVACIDSVLFQKFWAIILRVTKAFSDESAFHKPVHAEKLKDQLLKRGMILLDFLPKCPERSSEIAFWDKISSQNRTQFGRISMAIYVNETAFCWKQSSALANIIGVSRAK